MKVCKKIFVLLALMVTLIMGGALTANAYFYDSPEDCSHNSKQQLAAERNDQYYNNSFNEKGVVNPDANMCYLCGLECNHPLQYREYPSYITESDYYYSNGKHYLTGICTFCGGGYHNKGTVSGKPLIDLAKGEYCKNTCKQNMPQMGTPDSHATQCSVCGHKAEANCTFKVTNKPYYYGDSYISDSHDIIYTCTVCKGGKTYDKHNEVHSFKKNKCTKCGYKIIIPKNTKVTSAKQSGKAKVRTVKGGGYWQKTYVGSSGVNWKWIKPYSYKNRCYQIKFKLKKAKNADAYLVSTSKKFTGNSTQRFGKPSFTYNYTVSNKKRPTKIKLYITTVSKTGNYGKTISKTVKLKN